MRISRSGRRRALGALSAAAIATQMAFLREALAAGSVEKGIYRIKGDVRVNGRAAKEGMDVKAGDVITTGASSEVVLVTGRDALMIRSNSRVEVQGRTAALAMDGLRVITGAVLAVFAPGEPKQLTTPTATIGIRGTAAYLEIEPSRTYVCICYGVADLVSVMDPSARETISTTHHEQPRYVMGSGSPQMLMGAPVINHTDAELTLLESLVGRRPPFAPYPGDRPLSSY